MGFVGVMGVMGVAAAAWVLWRYWGKSKREAGREPARCTVDGADALHVQTRALRQALETRRRPRLRARTGPQIVAERLAVELRELSPWTRTELEARGARGLLDRAARRAKDPLDRQTTRAWLADLRRIEAVLTLPGRPLQRRDRDLA